MKVSEAVIEAFLRESVKEIGGIAYKFVSPGRRYVPDRICVFPTGIILFVEVKASNGVLHKGQQRELTRLTDLGASATVVGSRDDVRDLIQAVKDATVLRRLK